MDILVKREIAKRMLSPSQVEFTPVEPYIMKMIKNELCMPYWVVPLVFVMKFIIPVTE